MPRQTSTVQLEQRRTKQMKLNTREREHELAEALARYTDPDDPEYDPEFDREIRRLRPDWFEEVAG
jgi:hypothetical protein